MALGYATGSIAAQNLTIDSRPIKAQIVDGGAFASGWTGSTIPSADGTPYTQLILIGTKGARFGVYFEHLPVATLALIKAAVDAKLAADDPFDVTLADDALSISVDCMPDFSNGPWISYGKQRTNTFAIADVTMRFISCE